jgi:hypothetical protein
MWSIMARFPLCLSLVIPVHHRGSRSRSSRTGAEIEAATALRGRESSCCDHRLTDGSPVSVIRSSLRPRAVMLTLIQTFELNGVERQDWLPDMLAQIAEHEITILAALLPWSWKSALNLL